MAEKTQPNKPKHASEYIQKQPDNDNESLTRQERIEAEQRKIQESFKKSIQSGTVKSALEQSEDYQKAKKQTRPESSVEIERISSEKEQALDSEFKKKYVLDDAGNYRWAFNTQHTAFKEKGNKITAYSKSEQVPEDVVKLLASKGAEKIKITGTKSFKDKIWMAAQDRDIEVLTFQPGKDPKDSLWQKYEPSMAVKEEYEKTRNTVEKVDSTNDIAKKIKEDLKSKNLNELIKKNPDLAVLNSHQQAASLYAEKNIHKDSQGKFVETTMNVLINKVASGEKIPKINVVEKESVVEQER